jgi:hypothetical protein
MSSVQIVWYLPVAAFLIICAGCTPNAAPSTFRTASAPLDRPTAAITRAASPVPSAAAGNKPTAVVPTATEGFEPTPEPTNILLPPITPARTVPVPSETRVPTPLPTAILLAPTSPTTVPNVTPSNIPPLPVPLPVNAPQWQGGWTNIQPMNVVQQSFLPDSSQLRTIEVDIAAGSGSGGDTLTLGVLDKNGATLFTQSKDVPSGLDGWLRFDILGGGIQVVPGEILYLQLQDTGKIAFGWKYSSDTYPGGYAIFYGTPAMDMDYFFRVNQ